MSRGRVPRAEDFGVVGWRREVREMCLIRGIVLSGSVDGATGFGGAIIGIEEWRDSICGS
jgi:hypothetical protein